MESTRVSVIGEVGSLNAPPGSEAWAIAVRQKLLVVLHDKEDAENHLRVWRDAIKKHAAWKHLTDRYGQRFRTWEAFCVAPRPFGLGVESGELDAEVERREELRKTVGRPKKADTDNARNTGVSLGASDDRNYILARLERDGHAELLAAVYAGELSAHAAALQIGYRKKKTPLQQLEYWWAKASQAEREQFMSAIG